MRRRERIAKLKKKYMRTTHKFGIDIPNSVKHAIMLDEANGNTLWQDAIKKEMGKVRVAYKAKEGVDLEEVRAGKISDMIGYQEIK
jgi:hypothetical protein